MATPSASQWFAYLLTGDEATAKSVAAAGCQRIANDLSQSAPDTNTSGQQQGQFFAVDLFQAGDQPSWTIPHDPELVNFPLNSDLLAAKMKAELEDSYAIYGTRGVEDLGQSIKDAAQIHRMNLKADPPIAFANPTKFTSDDDVIKAAVLVARAYQDASAALDKRIKQAETDVQDQAALVGQERLDAAAQEIQTEAARYIQGASGLDNSTLKSLLASNKPSGQTILDAAGVAPLIGALRKIAARVAALQAASSALATKVGEMEEAFWDSAQWFDVFELPLSVTPEQAKGMFPAEAGKVEDAANALQVEVSAQCRAFPVLYRIWQNNNIPASVSILPTPTGGFTVAASTSAGGTAITKLTSSVWTTLRDSYQANLTFASNIAGDHTLTWRYPPLIDAALAKLQYTDPSVEFQAAREKLESEAGTDPITTLSMAVGAVDGAAILLAAAPEVLVVLAALTLAADAISSLADFKKNLQQSDAFHSVLDPSKAPASDPSYVGVMINMVATLLDVKGFTDAARTAQYARRAGAAQAAVEMITQ
jgi:hypothetical protein